MIHQPFGPVIFIIYGNAQCLKNTTNQAFASTNTPGFADL
jgi:hypothetical protein